jgi:anti-anti-sigma factor
MEPNDLGGGEMSADLVLSVSKQNGVWTVRPAGEIDLTTVDGFRETLEGLHGPILVDCSELSFIDARGLGALAAVRRGNGALTLRGTSPFLRRVVRTAGMGSVLALEER